MLNTIVIQGIGAIGYKSYIAMAFEVITFLNVVIAFLKNLSQKNSKG